MQVTETSADGLRREFRVVVPAADIASRVEGKLGELRRQVRLPGFRPGKVPLGVLRQRYGRSVMGEVLESTVNDAAQKTVADNGLRPAMQPKVEVTKFDEGADLECTVSVEVLPEIEAAAFDDLELERPVSEVTDAMVEEVVDRLLAQRRTYVPVTEERETREGDQLTIDFKGTVDGESRPGLDAEDQKLVLGSGMMVPGFEEPLAGRKAGDTVAIDLTFPADYRASELAGKPAHFDVTIKSVAEPASTAKDDEAAKTLGFDALDELRQAVRRSREAEFASLSRARLKRQLLDRLAERHHFPVPPGMVDLEFNAIWKQIEDAKKAPGPHDPDLDKPEEELRTEYRAIAERRVRLGLLLADVGRRNDIQVPPEDISRAITAESRRYPGREKEVLEYFRKTPAAVESLRAPLYEDRVVDHIFGLAKVTERQVTPEELQRDPDEIPAKTGDDAAEGTPAA